MKSKKFNTKLVLKKATVATLNQELAEKVKGGFKKTVFLCTEETCPPMCDTKGSLPPECLTYDCTIEGECCN